jgi:hypothetical protein
MRKLHNMPRVRHIFERGLLLHLDNGVGKKVALGFIVDASSDYVAIIENGRSRSIPIKDKEFSQYVAEGTKSAASD